ncbi:MAG: hypothetical protein N4A40_12215 [Tissierellales bacterium]|jgi:Holliday junction resolvase|nr:hypothetical protein [Tissierellales bacterium]
MKSYTIFYNSENPLYLKIENHEEFVNWFTNANSDPIFVYKSSYKTYYIVKDKINYMVEG